jgi:hypothetical protein
LISYSSYDNILNYCLNPKIDPNFTENQFENRCANYDNLSYLTKPISKYGKISSCKDYFTCNENKPSK